MVHRDRPHRRQVLVRLRREVVPDVPGERVGGERAARVGLEQRHRHPRLRGQVIAFQEIRGEHDLPHLFLEFVGFRRRPVSVPAFEIPGPGAAGGIHADHRVALRQLARVAAGAPLGEHGLAAREGRLVLGQIGLAAGSVLQVMRVRGLEEEERHGWRLRLGGLPVGGVFPGHADLDGRDGLPARERPEMEQPFLAEEPDVEVDAVEGPHRAHGIRSVLEDAGSPHGVRLLEKLRQRPVLDVVVELAVVQAAARQRLLAPALGHREPWPEVIDGVHRARIVDVIGGHERRVEAARPGGVEQLEHVVGLHVLGLGAMPGEDAVDPEVLGADVRAEVFPLRILRIVGRLDRVRPDVAEPARHADPVRPHELLPEVVALVGVVLRRIPLLGRRLIEIGIRKEPQADDAGRPSVGGADGQLVLAPRADGDARVLLVVLEGVGRTVGPPPVEPEPVPVGIGPFRLLEARLVDETEEVPAVVPARLEPLVRGNDLEQIEGPEAVDRDPVPEAVVSSRPHDPGVAPLDLLACQREAVIHVVEVILVRRRKRRDGPARAARLVQDASRLVLAATGEEHEAERQEEPDAAQAVVNHGSLLLAAGVRP